MNIQAITCVFISESQQFLVEMQQAPLSTVVKLHANSMKATRVTFVPMVYSKGLEEREKKRCVVL